MEDQEGKIFLLVKHLFLAGIESLLDFQFYHSPEPRHQSSFFKAETSGSDGTSPGSSVLFGETPRAPPQGAVSLGVRHQHCPCWPAVAQLHPERSKQSCKPREISCVLRLALVPQHCANIGVRPREQSWPESSQPAVWRALG